MQTLISHGLIARVSMFIDGFDDVKSVYATSVHDIESILKLSNDPSITKTVINASDYSSLLGKHLDKTVSSYIPIFLNELSSFIEALILSKKIFIDSVDRNHCLITSDRGIIKTARPPNSMYEFELQPIEINISGLTGGNGYSYLFEKLKGCLDIEIIDKTEVDQITAVWALYSCLQNMCDPNLCYDETGLSIKGMRLALEVRNLMGGLHFLSCDDAKLVQSLVDDTLGESWVEFYSVAGGVHKNIPDAFYPGPFNRNSLAECVGLNKLFFFFSLYEEIISSIQHTDLLTINSCSTSYYQLNSVEKFRLCILKDFSDTARKKAHEISQTSGVNLPDLLLPQLLQMCLSGAKSFQDVVDNALYLRERSWVRRFSSYLDELSHQENDFAVIRHTQTLESFVEKKLKGSVALGNGNISFSPYGNISFSQGALLDMFRARANRATHFQSKSISYITKGSGISVIARILKTNERNVMKHLV